MRSTSRLSTADERLASSAPSVSNVLAGGLEYQPFLLPEPHSGDLGPDFHLVEIDEDETPHLTLTTPTVYLPISGFAGIDDCAEAVIMDEYGQLNEDTFSASPVLISCLRDISKMSQPKVN